MIESSLKRACFGVLNRLGVIVVSEALANGVPILAYHGVTELPGSHSSNLRRLHVSKTLFEGHLALLASQWRPIRLSALCNAMEMKRSLPPRSVVVTLDDGYRNNLTVAWPLLKHFRIPATIFVLTGPRPKTRMWIDRVEAAVWNSAVPGVQWHGRLLRLTTAAEKQKAIAAFAREFICMGEQREAAIESLCASLRVSFEEPDPDRDLLTWDEIRLLRDAGLEIGSHADYHEPLPQRSPKEVGTALTESRETLERELGAGRYALSYPYGAWNQELAGLARQAGFFCAVTTDRGLNRASSDAFGLKRFLVGADDDVLRLRASLSGLRSLWRFGSVRGSSGAGRPQG
jgi:peptidoglycan/xylan/chitin deacetylase (PgdA/CDA1 family)